VRHGTGGFTSPPKEGMLRIFSPRKIRRLRPGLNLRTWVPEASMLTTRPPKPLNLCLKHPQITLMFVQCIIRRNRNNQHYAPINTTPLFYIPAPTCFGSSLPPAGSFLDPSELLEIQIDWVACYMRCGYVALRHTGHVTTHYMIYNPIDLYFK
jgi:hypothetical protein